MTTLLLIRHGESMANTEKRFAGHLNVPLSDVGKAQAEVTADHIVSHYTVDAVYASDLLRAFHTGKAVADLLGVPTIPNRDLREICAGDWEGVTFDDLEKHFPVSYSVWRSDIGNAVCDNGESVAALQKRFLSAICRIAAENDGKTMVIGTHATPIRTLQCHCEGKSLDEMASVPWVTNASITVVEYENGKLRLVQVGNDAHLGQNRTTLPANV